MKELALAHQGLLKIVQEDISFKKAQNVLFPHSSSDRKYIGSVSSLLGCELRHHLLFSQLLKEAECELTIEEETLLRLALANHFFLKKLNEDEIKKIVKDSLKDKYTDKIDRLLNYSGSIAELVQLDHSDIEYVSIRFNTPSWLIKMWNKHYGKGLSFKTLKTNSMPSKTFVRLAKDNVTLDEAKFVKTDVKDIYEYIAKEPLRKQDVYQNGDIFQLRPIIKDVLDRYYNPIMNECTLYSGEDDSIVREFYTRSLGKCGINLVVPDMSKRADIMRFIRLNNIKNINLFMANDSIAYQTGLSHPQELVFLYPSSSSFSRIHIYPDYLLHFKRDSFDTLIKKQKEVIEDLSKYVLPDGYLIYMVDTLNKKESSSIVTNFLLDNPQFTLIEEQQLFPFDKGNSTIYYAVMKKSDNV